MIKQKHFPLLSLLLTFVAGLVSATGAYAQAVSEARADIELPALQDGITSFGAAVAEDALYLYGGHKGRAHHYYRSGQVNELWKLDLKKPKQWEVIAKGPHLQGLAMVAYGGKLYRLGGFTAHNKEDDDHDLRSIADVAAFDPSTNHWQPQTPLPEPRSSFDAVVIGYELYVAGGWQLGGDDDKGWHNTAYVADLRESPIKWVPLPEPPFRRRALSLGQLNGKLYAIGGMQEEGGPTTRVDIYDPIERTWREGPSMIVPEGKSNSPL